MCKCLRARIIVARYTRARYYGAGAQSRSGSGTSSRSTSGVIMIYQSGRSHEGVRIAAHVLFGLTGGVPASAAAISSHEAISVSDTDHGIHIRTTGSTNKY